MNFPTWTLWGMGIAAAVALLLLLFSLYRQAPGVRTRASAEPYRQERQVRALTSYALAALLLAFGFFLTAVIRSGRTVSVVEPTSSSISAESDVVASAATATLPQTPESGAFGGPPPTETQTPTPALTTITVAAAADGATTVPATSTSTPTITPTPTLSPTPTATFTPTPTPFPTYTPTPIDDPTAVIDTQGSTLWVRQTPGGTNITLINHNDTVIVRNGNANRNGAQWQEIMTIDGVVGWVQAQFLDYGTGS